MSRVRGNSHALRATKSLVARARDEADLRSVYPEVRHRTIRNRTADRYDVVMPVPGYEPRLITLEVERGTPQVAVYADGPTLSPHRYPERGGRRLCLWYPSDPPERRWERTDGLVALLALTAAHLFQEAWWREHRQWLGDEAPHPVPDAPTPAPATENSSIRRLAPEDADLAGNPGRRAHGETSLSHLRRGASAC